MIIWRNIENHPFFNFDSHPRFPQFLLYVRWKSGVIFVPRCFHDVLNRAACRENLLFGLVKIRVAIYVAQLAKNERLNFELFSQQLFLPKLLGLEFHNGFKICQTIFLLQHVFTPMSRGLRLYNVPHNIIKIGSNCCNIVSLWCIF